MRSQDDPDLTVVDGLCNHCRRYDALLGSRVLEGEPGRRAITALVDKMRKSRKKNGYDCVIGVSGGVDSTYVALKAKELGLNPLAVHVDNGWNSETAVGNIQKTLDRLGIELHTEVLDLREFYDLQRSFLEASTPDGDIPADHAIQATLWKVARKHGIRFIISGMNFRTEAISVPAWSYGHSDWKYIRSVHKRYGRYPLKSYPHYGFLELFYTTVIRRVRIVSILNYLPYSKAAAIKELQEALGWTPYGGKHYESVYTRYYQGHVLPHKFDIDKRRGHLSDLINAHQISREDALAELESSDYEGRLRAQDEVFVLKKLGYSDQEFEALMAAPVRSFRDFSNSYDFVQFLRRTVNALRERGLYPR
jgi:N-acetyl sugar amidotransferase